MASTIFIPTNIKTSIDFATAAGTTGATLWDEGTISFFSAMIDTCSDCIKNGKPAISDAMLALCKAGLATPDLLQGTGTGVKVIQCAADIGELAIASTQMVLGMSVTGGLALIAAGAGLLAQVFSTARSCSKALFGIFNDVKDLTKAGLKKVSIFFKTISSSVSNWVNLSARIIMSSLNPDNYQFNCLNTQAQDQLSDFLGSIRLFNISKYALKNIFMTKVSQSTAKSIAQGVLLANKYEFKTPPSNAVALLSASEISTIASSYENKTYGAAFSKLAGYLFFFPSYIKSE